MKKQILFIHSAGLQGPGEGSSDLVAYLQKMLGAEYDVLRPEMPDPDNPEYKAWEMQLEKELAGLNGEAILIGHSLGGSVLLKYLSEKTYKRPVAGLFLVAAPYWRKKGWTTDEYVLQNNFPAKLLRIPEIFIYHSREDEIVPFSHLQAYAEKLPHAKVRALNGYEHAFTQGLPVLTEDIKKLKVNTAGKNDRLKQKKESNGFLHISSLI